MIVELDISPPTFVCCVYIPPSGSCSTEYFSEMIQFINTLPNNQDLLLVGDFNAPDINWDRLTASSLRSSVLCDAIFAKNMIQLVDHMTHQSGSTLDLILCNCPSRVSNISIDDGLVSDHCLISYWIQGKPTRDKNNGNTIINCYSRADLVGLDGHLLDADFSDAYNATNINDCSSLIKQILSQGCDLFIPRIKIPSICSPLDLNQKLVKLCILR